MTEHIPQDIRGTRSLVWVCLCLSVCPYVVVWRARALVNRSLCWEAIIMSQAALNPADTSPGRCWHLLVCLSVSVCMVCSLVSYRRRPPPPPPCTGCRVWTPGKCFKTFPLQPSTDDPPLPAVRPTPFLVRLLTDLYQ